MNKGNEFYQEFINSWRQGWASYPYSPNQDNKPIYEIAEKCARVSKVTLDEEPGFIRVCQALTSIGSFCYNSKEWRDKNLFQINQALQTIILQMMADKRNREEEQQENNLAEKVYLRSKAEREKIEQQMKTDSENSKKWVENNWTEENETAYQAWRKSLEPGKVISIETGIDLTIKRAL